MQRQMLKSSKPDQDATYKLNIGSHQSDTSRHVARAQRTTLKREKEQDVGRVSDHNSQTISCLICVTTYAPARVTVSVESMTSGVEDEVALTT